MNHGIRFTRDVLWIVAMVAAAVAIYRLIADPSSSTTLTNLTLGVGALASILLLALAKTYGKAETAPDSSANFDRDTGMWMPSYRDSFSRIALLSMLALPLAAGLVHAGVLSPKAQKLRVLAPRAADELREVLVIDGDRDGDKVVFDHAAHQKIAGGDGGCVKCHHIHKPGDQATSCYPCHSSMTTSASIFDHALHQSELGGAGGCDNCHQSENPRSALGVAKCERCHEENMGLDAWRPAGLLSPMAPAYPNAMHGVCVDCHRKGSASSQEAGCLGCCDTCHQARSREKDALNVAGQ